MARDTAKKPKRKRFQQVKQTYTMAKRSDPRILLWSLGTLALVLAAFVGVGLVLGSWYFWLIIGLPIAVLAGAVIFGRRAERAAYSQLEGQPGAAASALGTLRRGWIVTNAVAVNRNQDMVHRVLGRPGIVLVGEGNPHRVTQMLASERKRHTRVAYDVTVHEVVLGRGEGQVPLPRLAKHVMKLPKKLRGADVTELNNRLRALNTSPVPMPKGPLPRNVKMPKDGISGGQR